MDDLEKALIDLIDHLEKPLPSQIRKQTEELTNETKELIEKLR